MMLETNNWALNWFWFTLWLFNMAMENGPFIDDVPIKTSIYKGFSMAMLNNQMVTLLLRYNTCKLRWRYELWLQVHR